MVRVDLPAILFIVALGWLFVFNFFLFSYGWDRVPPERRRYLLMIFIGLYGLWLVALLDHLLT